MSEEEYIGNLSLDEVKKLRNEKKSWGVIRDFCGVSRYSFQKFVKQHALSDGKKYSHKKREYTDSGIAQELARRDGYENLTDAIRYLRLISGKTFAEVEEYYKGHGGLVRKYYPKDIKVHINTHALIGHAIEQCYKNAKNRKGHPWTGMYYTPEPLPLATGTGTFLKQAADELVKDEFQNPPFGEVNP